MFEDVARLAVELPADRFQGGKADRFRLAGLEHGKVGRSDAHRLGELRWDAAAGVPVVVLDPKLDPTLRNQVLTRGR